METFNNYLSQKFIQYLFQLSFNHSGFPPEHLQMIYMAHGQLLFKYIFLNKLPCFNILYYISLIILQNKYLKKNNCSDEDFFMLTRL